jgi:hypothetical protein
MAAITNGKLPAEKYIGVDAISIHAEIAGRIAKTDQSR